MVDFDKILREMLNEAKIREQDVVDARTAIAFDVYRIAAEIAVGAISKYHEQLLAEKERS